MPCWRDAALSAFGVSTASRSAPAPLSSLPVVRSVYVCTFLCCKAACVPCAGGFGGHTRSQPHAGVWCIRPSSKLCVAGFNAHESHNEAGARALCSADADVEHRESRSGSARGRACPCNAGGEPSDALRAYGRCLGAQRSVQAERRGAPRALWRAAQPARGAAAPRSVPAPSPAPPSAGRPPASGTSAAICQPPVSACRLVAPTPLQTWWSRRATRCRSTS